MSTSKGIIVAGSMTLCEGYSAGVGLGLGVASITAGIANSNPKQIINGAVMTTCAAVTALHAHMCLQGAINMYKAECGVDPVRIAKAKAKAKEKALKAEAKAEKSASKKHGKVVDFEAATATI